MPAWRPKPGMKPTLGTHADIEFSQTIWTQVTTIHSVGIHSLDFTMKTSQYIFRYETFCDGLGAYKEVGCNARELTAVTDY